GVSAASAHRQRRPAADTLWAAAGTDRQRRLGGVRSEAGAGGGAREAYGDGAERRVACRADVGAGAEAAGGDDRDDLAGAARAAEGCGFRSVARADTGRPSFGARAQRAEDRRDGDQVRRVSRPAEEVD